MLQTIVSIVIAIIHRDSNDKIREFKPIKLYKANLVRLHSESEIDETNEQTNNIIILLLFNCLRTNDRTFAATTSSYQLMQ